MHFPVDLCVEHDILTYVDQLICISGNADLYVEQDILIYVDFVIQSDQNNNCMKLCAI